MTNEPASCLSPPPRRWQWSLRVMLVSMAVLGAGLGLVGMFLRWQAERTNLRRTIDPILMRHEATVAVKHGEIVWLSLSGMDANVSIPDLHDFGVTYFHSSIGTQGPYAPVDDTRLRQLLDEMPHLRALDLRNTATTAGVLPQIAKLEKLEWIWLDNAHCDNNGLLELRRIRSLRRLYLDRTNLSDADVQRLRETMPNCEIHIE